MSVVASSQHAGDVATERRRAHRVHLPSLIPAVLGRGDAIVLDVGGRGVRARHRHNLRCGSTVRLSFTWFDQRFSIPSVVLASRVAGVIDGAMTYESRLAFPEGAPGVDALTELIERNIGETRVKMAPPAVEPVTPQEPLIICELEEDGEWRITPTSDAAQPREGFVVRREIPEQDIDAMRAMYTNSAEDVRHFIQQATADALRSNPAIFRSSPDEVRRFVRSATAEAYRKYIVALRKNQEQEIRQTAATDGQLAHAAAAEASRA